MPDSMMNGSMMNDSAVYKTLLESTKAIPWKIDWATMTFAYIGPQIETLLGWPQGSWLSANDWAERMHPEDREWVVNFCVAQSQSGIDHEADYRALTRDGRYVWIRDVVHVLRNAAGEVEALVGFMFDISERKQTEQKLLQLQKQLEELSYQDGLTGVANRRMFDNRFQMEQRPAHQPAAVADPVGYRLLQAVQRSLWSCARRRLPEKRWPGPERCRRAPARSAGPLWR